MNPVERQWLTLAILVAVALFLIVSDVWLASRFGPAATYSRVMAHVFAQHPIILVVVSFSAGVTLGTACFRSTRSDRPPPRSKSPAPASN